MFQAYRRILELDPVNIQGLHNLCVVHVERGKLLEARECLEKAHALAPEEDYVLRHLQIVQNRIAKMQLNSPEQDVVEKSKVVSNKSADSTQKKSEPVVSRDSEEQRYSSRVVNTEPLFVNNVEEVSYPEYSVEETIGNDQNTSKWNEKRLGSDNDDPSSGMS